MHVLWTVSRCVVAQLVFIKYRLIFLHSTKTSRVRTLIWATDDGTFEIIFVTFGSYHFTNIFVTTESPNLERSNRDIRKTRNVFKNLRFCGKRKNCTLRLTRILTFTRLQAFCLQLVTFKILNSSPSFGVDRHFYMVSPSYHELGSFRECKFLSPIFADIRALSIDQNPVVDNRRRGEYTC